MGNMDLQHLGNATSTTLLHQLTYLWKSPRGTVLRIEALALLAIALSFFLAAFGSCRRWSNRWIIQKGFIAANALFMSLGTYSIGLMQSSPVKSEMYPIWAVSLLALLCCVDSAAASGLDDQSQLWKMLYQLCLYCGYVLLMSISTISSDIGNVAICVLSAITLMKGFHRSMALVLPSSMRNMIRDIPDNVAQYTFGDPDREAKLIVDMPLDVMKYRRWVRMGDIAPRSHGDCYRDVCLSFSLSHLLQRRFLGLGNAVAAQTGHPLVGNYGQAFKVVEVELAFLYDVLFTSNAFLYYYEAKVGSIWAFASVIGICFTGVVAVIPRTRATRHASPGTIVVDATTADLIITVVILVSLALLQVFQLLSCWTSNWARVSLACDYARSQKKKKERRKEEEEDEKHDPLALSWTTRLKASLVKINWFENYLWQNKLGQHSLVESVSSGHRWQILDFLHCCIAPVYLIFSVTLGLQYIGRLLREMLFGGTTGDAVDLHPDVKASIVDFVTGIRCNEVSGWACSQVENGQSEFPEYTNHPRFEESSDAEVYTSCILTWHITTWYCEVAQQHDDKGFLKCTDSERAAVEKDHRVAMALSKYILYLVVSAPRLLPGQPDGIKNKHDQVRDVAFAALRWQDDRLEAVERFPHLPSVQVAGALILGSGVELGKGLRKKPAPVRWKLLAEFWVKALLYAAPSDNVEEHMKHLSQGGELITHLWAVLYHAGIHKWQLNPPPDGEQAKEGWDYIFRFRPRKDPSPERVQGRREHTGTSPKRDDGSSSSQPPLSTEATPSRPRSNSVSSL